MKSFIVVNKLAFAVRFDGRSISIDFAVGQLAVAVGIITREGFGAGKTIGREFSLAERLVAICIQ